MRARVVLLIVGLLAAVPGTGRAEQDDAGSRADAGDTFDAATTLVPRGFYTGRLDRANGDRHDYYKFHLDEGTAVSVLVTVQQSRVDPVTILDPEGRPVDAATKVSSLGVSGSGAFTAAPGELRVTVHKALVPGDYRLHIQTDQIELAAYDLCFLNCEPPQDTPIQLIFGGSLKHTETRVLLVPPSHGDLGNPLGPSVVDYLNATLRGMHRWTAAMDAFAARYSQYAYLRQITVEVEIFDGAVPVEGAGYDVIVAYVAAGPVFRGVASDPEDDVEQILEEVGLDEDVHWSGRVIALSLFGASPRAGQVMWDFPEINDLEIVTTHEFAHTFGLGHTGTWHAELGPDLMNSPATFIYGDGFPAGDGGERTPLKCLSTLDLYGMAELYRWIPSGQPVGSFGAVELPPEIPYEMVCA